MDRGLLERSFEKIGAAVDFAASPKFSVDVIHAKKTPSFFRLTSNEDEDLTILDVQPSLRHLLLLRKDGNEKFRFLLGHDERDWFVAGVPDNRAVSTVRAAMDALKPPEVLDSIQTKGLKRKHKNKRHNKAFIRQGEWFFIPVNENFKEHEIHRNEPIQRGRSKPHVVSELVRVGGRTVYVHHRYPDGVSVEEYNRIIKQARSESSLRFSLRIGWSRMTADAIVYGRGTVRHPDHATIKLPGWHRIVTNTEDKASAMEFVAFLD